MRSAERGIREARHSAYVGLLADPEGLADVQRLAEAGQPAADVLEV